MTSIFLIQETWITMMPIRDRVISMVMRVKTFFMRGQKYAGQMGPGSAKDQINEGLRVKN
jgi:hypothetical protein